MNYAKARTSSVLHGTIKTSVPVCMECGALILALTPWAHCGPVVVFLFEVLPVREAPCGSWVPWLEGIPWRVVEKTKPLEEPTEGIHLGSGDLVPQEEDDPH